MRFLFLKTSIKKLVWLVGLLLVPFTGYADDARDKVVTLQFDGVTLKRFFDEIHSQTGVDFIYTPQQARYVEPITVNVTNANLGRVLDNVFRGKDLEYTEYEPLFNFVSPAEKSSRCGIVGLSRKIQHLWQ